MRRLLVGALFALGLAGPTVGMTALLGDVNLDGKVDSADYTLLNQYLAATATLNWEQRDAADVAPLGTGDQVGDGVVDSADALVFDSALNGDDVDGDGLNVASETGGTTATNGSPFLNDTDGDSAPDDVDSARGSFDTNQAPAASTIAVTSVTTTTLSGTVSACSDSDGLPYPSSCTQEVRLVAAGASCESATEIAAVTPSSGTWSATGLTSGVVYTVYAWSSDGALATCSDSVTRSTTPTSNAPTTPYLEALPAATTSNPVTLSGFGAPGQEIRVWVDGAEQDYVRSFVDGNSEFSTNPFIVASDGTFSIPVVLDDELNRVQVTAIGAGAAESALSNETTTSYENAITRDPLGLPVVNEGGFNRHTVDSGAIVVFTKGVAPGVTGEYRVQYRYLEVKPEGLLVVQPGATIKFDRVSNSNGNRRRLVVGGSLQILGEPENLAKLYSLVGQQFSWSWRGIEFLSTSRVNKIDYAEIEEAKKPIILTGDVTDHPDLTLLNSDFPSDNYSNGYDVIDIDSGGDIVLRNNRIVHTLSACTGTAISITDSTSAEIVGSNIQKLYFGIVVDNTPATIEHNYLSSKTCDSSDDSVSRAISLIGGPNTSRIADNLITDNWKIAASQGKWARGIHLEDSDATIEDNILNRVNEGIFVEKVNASSMTPMIRNNRILDIKGGNKTPTGGNVAIQVDGQAAPTITGNLIDNSATGNGFYEARGIRISVAGDDPIEISDNQISHIAFGIQIMNGSTIPTGEDITIENNSLDDINKNGIYLESSQAEVTGNTLLDVGTISQSSYSDSGGIFSLDSEPNIAGNEIRGARYAIRVSGGTPDISDNEITDGVTGLQGGIRLSGSLSGTSIQGNRISGYTGSNGFGIRLSEGAIATIDGGNVITGNRNGILVKGTGDPSDTQPLPVVSGNGIYDNVSGSTKQNYRTDGYTTSPQTTLDLTGNWWGVASPTQTTAGIVIGSVGSGSAPAVDFSGALSGPGTNYFIGQMSAKIDSTDSRRAYLLPDPTGNPVPVATVSFEVYDSAASVVLRICPESAASCNSSTAIYSSTGQTFSVGTASITWDGTDDAGKVVAAEAYTYALEATKSAVTQVIDPSGYSAEVNWEGSETTAGGTIVTTSYDTFTNEAFQITAKMSSLMRHGRIWFDVLPIDDQGRPQPTERFVAAPNGYPLGAPLRTATSSQGTHSRTLTWNGRNPSGEIIEGTAQIVARVFPMKDNVILVDAASPVITSSGGAVDIPIDPYLINDVFEQVASFTFKVDRVSDVTITLLPPNSWSDTGAPSWLLEDVAANTATSLLFKGHKEASMVGVSADEARELLADLAEVGAFTFRIRAADDVSGRETDAYVTVQMRH